MFERLSFRAKILLLIGSAFCGLAVMAVLSVYQSRQEIMQGRIGALRSAVQSQATIVSGFVAAAKSGATSEEDAKKAAIDAVRKARYGDLKGKADYFFIITTDARAVMHPFLKWQPGAPVGGLNKLGVDPTKAYVDAIAASPDGTAMVEMLAAKPGDTGPDAVMYPKAQYLIRIPEWNWIVASGLYLDDVQAQMRVTMLEQLAMCALVLAALSVLGVVVTRSVLGQLGGDPKVAIDVMAQVAHGDLVASVPQAKAGSLLDELGRMVKSMGAAVAQVRASSDGITTASAQVAAGSQDLSTRTEQTAANLQEAASSMEEITSTVRHAADSAQQAHQLALSAAEVAQRGGAVISDVVATMDAINSSSKRIADITGLIDGIAFQTNILALNAAVEAARAGDHGRGFAVVAAEVRSLARRSADAAKEIKQLIDSSVASVATGARLVDDAGSTMTDIVDSVKRVSGIVGEISTAAVEQSRGVEQVREAVAQLDQMTQQNAALVEESTAAAQALMDQATRLKLAVDIFQVNPA